MGISKLSSCHRKVRDAFSNCLGLELNSQLVSHTARLSHYS
jgi:hypothetical protein